MNGIVNEKTRKAADIKAEKRAAALRENLKKRKEQARAATTGESKNADPENRE